MSEAEETQPTEEEESEPNDEEATAEPAPETTEPSTPKPTNEIKVVIVIKDANILLGVQSPDCDPLYRIVKGTLAAALKQVPVLIKEAKEKWATTPLNPKANLPEPPPRPAPARTTVASQPAKPKEQPSFF